MRTISRLLVIVMLVSAALVPVDEGRAAGGPVPEVLYATGRNTSRPVRQISSEHHAGSNTKGQHAPLRKEHAGRQHSGARDPAVQRKAGSSVPSKPNKTFDGLRSTDNLKAFGFKLTPPDTNGDVGPNHYVQFTNDLLRVFKKSGKKLIKPTPFSAIWAGSGLSPCEDTDSGDPIALYDPLADRWLLSEFSIPSFSGPFFQCIAVSTSPDPTGSYHLYQFPYSPTELNDYPKFGVWPDGYYMSANEFTDVGTPGEAFDGVGVVAFDRTAMLAGGPAVGIKFDLESSHPLAASLLPSDLDGPPPPSGSPNYFVELAGPDLGYASPAVNVYEFHADFVTPLSSTFTGPVAAPASAFDPDMCGFFSDCIPQPYPFAGLDAISDRLMYRAQYRNFGSHESIVTNHTVDVGSDHAGVRWYELRDPGGTPAIFQQSTFAPDALHRWMGSAAMDGDGNLAVGYSTSGTSSFPSIRYAGRLATDAPDTLGGEQIMHAGKGSQTSSRNRWGDYSALTVDPTDDCTFWYTNQYYKKTTEADWRTRIGSFSFPGCS